MAQYAPVWSSILQYGPVFSSMPLLQRGTVLSSSMAQYGPVRPRMAKQNWPSMAQYAPVWSSILQHGSVWSSTPRGPVCSCLSSSTAQYGPGWLSMSQYGPVSSSMLLYRPVCSSMLQPVCSIMAQKVRGAPVWGHRRGQRSKRAVAARLLSSLFVSPPEKCPP